MFGISWFERANSVAPAGYNRWLVPPAALCIHMSIGQIYAYSVFNKPLSLLIGISAPSPDDWDLKTIGWIFSIALFCLGASAAVFGKWVERSGPRKTMFVSALFFSGGFFVSALGVQLHQIALLYLGHGVMGGIGLGLGYISPVSTLIKWFPDKPGMATGLAIMGFGGGAMVASPLSVFLMDHFRSATSSGVPETFIAMGFIYLSLIVFAMLIVRVPPADAHWLPQGVAPPNPMTVRSGSVSADHAIRTPQYYLLFGVLMLNVTAGIGVLGQASVMIQEMFSESAVGKEHAVSEAAAAGFVGLLSLFNMLGRFFWSSLSDRIGRRNTYTVFFALGSLLYFIIPYAGRAHSIVFFVGLFCIILSMYGGGFATIPAYIRDLFGGKQVGAIHGRVLLGWSAAAILGPMLVNYLRAYQIETLHLPKADAYSFTMQLMSGLLLIGLLLNLLIKKVNPNLFEREEDIQ